MIDPYLIPGQLCEVWDFIANKRYYKFELYNDVDIALFNINKKYPVPFDKYRPIGTEWDFAPGRALDPKNKNACSTVDADGTIQIFWSNDGNLSLDKLKPKDNKWIHAGFANHITVGICKDEERVKNWKSSMRMRPAWAEVTRCATK